MTEFISKHGIKIQVSVAIAVIGALIWFGAQTGAVLNDVQENTVQARKVPLIEYDISLIRGDVKEIKSDIKLLLKR